jgi:hypothetical protein
MTDTNIIRFPGFILLNDRNTIIKDGKRYKSMKAMMTDLEPSDLKRTYDWYCDQQPWRSTSYRGRLLYVALYGDATANKSGAA